MFSRPALTKTSQRWCQKQRQPAVTLAIGKTYSRPLGGESEAPQEAFGSRHETGTITNRSERVA
jgi:hypothetical protein